MLEKIHKNCTGTISIIAKFGKMKKAQDFVTYPIEKLEDITRLPIQSHNRFGYIFPDGSVKISPNRAQYANSMHYLISLKNGKIEEDQLTTEEMASIREEMAKTAGTMVGNNNIVYCDNSKANLFWITITKVYKIA